MQYCTDSRKMIIVDQFIDSPQQQQEPHQSPPQEKKKGQEESQEERQQERQQERQEEDLFFEDPPAQEIKPAPAIATYQRPEPTQQQMRKRKKMFRRELQQREANEFLKQPVVKIVNLNKNLKRAYEPNFLDDSKYEYIHKLRKLRRHPQQDSVSSHVDSDQSFDIKDVLPKRRSQKRRGDDDQVLSSDSNSEKATKKRKPARPRKPKIKKEDVDENGQPIPKKQRKPRVKTLKAKPIIKIAKPVAPKRQTKQKEPVKIELKSQNNVKGPNEESSSQSQFQSEQNSQSKSQSSSAKVKDEKESKQPPKIAAKVIEKNIEEEKRKVNAKQIVVQKINEKPIVKQIQKAIEQKNEKIIAKPVEKIQSVPAKKTVPPLAVSRANLLPPTIVKRQQDIKITEATAAALKKLDELQSSDSSSSSSQSSSSASDSSSDKSREKKKKKHKHKKYRNSSSESSHNRKKKKNQKKKKKYDESQTAKQIVRPSVKSELKIVKEPLVKEKQANQKNVVPQQQIPEQKKQIDVQEQLQKELKAESSIQNKQMIKQSQPIKDELTKPKPNLSRQTLTQHVIGLKQEKAQPTSMKNQNEMLTSDEQIKKKNKKGIQLKFDPKVVVLSLMTGPNSNNAPSKIIQNIKTAKNEELKPQRQLARPRNHDSYESSQDGSSFIQYRKPHRHPPQRVVRYRKVVVSETSSDESQEGYVDRRVVKRIRRPKVIIEPPSDSEYSSIDYQRPQYKSRQVDPKPKPHKK